jgi:hypothetical protein
VLGHNLAKAWFAYLNRFAKTELVRKRELDMTTRRRFLQTLALLPPALSVGSIWSATSSPTADPSRLALVIGNGAYRQAPLINPVNDARGVAGLFGQAGFTVDSQINATRNDMMAAIEHFGEAVRQPEIKLVIFYFSGHGVQLDWRNYLLPVDVMVESSDQIKQRCIDLNEMLGRLGKTKDKTFVIILDACRNDPFGGAYRAEQRGLSQFDAPVGSLLAYSTSPGSVASDGAGLNGLYTENLLREFSVRSTRIEDALKRVRLNVRISSRGTQIPWETTSLENDIFIFNDERKKLSAAEIEAELETELAEWSRIKSSKMVDDWISYLQKFPNGRFGEIAQVRLSRLLAEVEQKAAEQKVLELAQQKAVEQKMLESEQQKATEQKTLEMARQKIDEPKKLKLARTKKGAQKELKTTPTESDPSQPAGAAFAEIDLGSGGSSPQLLQPSPNPYSGGTYPLGRIFSVGDRATFSETDLTPFGKQTKFTRRVTHVDIEADRVEFNDGKVVTDLMGNDLKTANWQADTPRQFAPAELQLGKKWRAAYRRIWKGKFGNIYYDFQIARREKVSVPAGIFDCFKIVGEGWNTTSGNSLEGRLWIVPGLNFSVKEEWESWHNGRKETNLRRELLTLRQKTFKMTRTRQMVQAVL